MRGFFLLLLLTNVAFVVWQYSRSAGESEGFDIYHGISLVNEGLTMIGELPPEKQPALREEAVEEEAAVTEPATAGRNVTAGMAETSGQADTQRRGAGEADIKVAACWRIAEIDDKPMLEQVLSALQDSGATAIEQSEVQSTRTNYWVMLPPYPSREKADEAAKMLAAKKIRDFFIVRSGEYVNAVSLGVFSTRERAERRYRQIVALNARLRRPKIEAIELPAKRYTVSYKIGEREALSKLATDLKALKGPESKEITCK